MTTKSTIRSRPGRLAAASLGALAVALCTGGAWAQEAPAPSDNAMVNLVRQLVKQGVLTQANGDALIAQAEAEAAQARATAAQPAAAPALPPAAPGAVRVPYVPEVVKQELREEIRKEVLAQAKSENWAQPNAIPEWVNRFEFSGDLRVRNQFDLYSDSNTNEFIDFAAFNENGPIDVNPVTNPGGVPFLNTREDRRNRLSIRARLGVKAHIADGVEVGVRLASGNDDGPVSTTQILGGGMRKKDVWLDQAYVKIQPIEYVGVVLGRMPNPFVTTDLLYDEDLNFDGLAARLQTGDDLFGQPLQAFANLGVFALEYVGNNFPANSLVKEEEHGKWLYGVQAGVDWKPVETVSVRGAVGYFSAEAVRGQQSEPCALYLGADGCSTDPTRPAFMQKGNTLFLLRQIALNPALADPADNPLPQFVGLSFDYDLLNLNASLEAQIGDRYRLKFDADYVTNLAFKESDICRYGAGGLPVNNVTPASDGTFAGLCDVAPDGVTPARFESGADAWMVRALFGDLRPRKAGEWNVAAGYKRIEPDALLDGLTDSDFHLGGTNAEGYFLSAQVGLFDNVRLGGRWLSANEVFGPPLAIDVGQIELNVGF